MISVKHFYIEEIEYVFEKICFTDYCSSCVGGMCFMRRRKGTIRYARAFFGELEYRRHAGVAHA